MKTNTIYNTTCEKYQKSTNYEKFSEFLVFFKKIRKTISILADFGESENM